MNRRVFVTTGAAAFALTATRIAAQAGETTYQTKLTGSTIDLGDSGFEFGQTQSARNQEMVELISGETTAGIYFFPPFADFQEAVDNEVDTMLTNFPDVEIVASEIFDDGAWALMHYQDNGVQTVKYGEIQAGAYPEFDLVIELISQPDAYEDMITAFQTITIDGMPPFLFLEDSDSVALVAAIPAAMTTTTGRTSRSSRGTTTDPTPTPESGQTTRKSRSSKTTSTTDDGSYREAVRAHRLEFQESLAVFAQALGILTDSSSAKSATDKALIDIDAVSDEWILYPDRFAELTASASESSLAGLYETWCDEIAILAETWQDARVGNANADDILNQFSVVIDADDALGAELNEPAAARQQVLGLRAAILSVA